MRRHPILAVFTITYIIGWTMGGLILGRPQVWGIIEMSDGGESASAVSG